MSSLSNLQPQQGYNNQQQPYHNYSQTTQHPPQNLGQRAGETSLAITKDPRFIAAIFSFFFALGFGYSVYQSFNFVGLIMFVFNVGIVCAGARIMFGRGQFSQYITEYELPNPTIKPPANKSLCELFKACYLASAIFSGLNVIGCVILVYSLVFDDYNIDLPFKLPILIGLCILTFFIFLLVTFFCYKSFILEHESLEQWDRIHGQNDQQGDSQQGDGEPLQPGDGEPRQQGDRQRLQGSGTLQQGYGTIQ